MAFEPGFTRPACKAGRFADAFRADLWASRARMTNRSGHWGLAPVGFPCLAREAFWMWMVSERLMFFFQLGTSRV